MRDLLDSKELAAGLGPGLVALVAAIALGAGWRAWRKRRLPAGGLLFAAAGVVALRGQVDVPDVLAVGIGLLAAAGLTGDVLRAPLLLRAALSIPGAYVVAVATEVSTERWVQVAVGVAIVVGGSASSDFDRRWRRPSIGTGLLAITAGGIYLTIPDTESILCVLAPIAFVAAVAWPGGLLRLGSGGAFAAVGLLAWITAFGGIGRDGSIVGGLASLGLLVAEPVAAWFAGFRSSLVRQPTWRSAIGMGVAQGALVIVTARVAGLREDAVPAAAIAGVALLLAAIACVVVGTVWRSRRPQSADGMVPPADTR